MIWILHGVMIMSFNLMNLFPPLPHQFELEQGFTFDVYQPLYEKSLEDTFQEFMKGQKVLNKQMVEFQEQTTRAIGDILE